MIYYLLVCLTFNVYACVAIPPVADSAGLLLSNIILMGPKGSKSGDVDEYIQGSVLNTHAAGCKTLCYIIYLFAQCQSLISDFYRCYKRVHHLNTCALILTLSLLLHTNTSCICSKCVAVGELVSHGRLIRMNHT